MARINIESIRAARERRSRFRKNRRMQIKLLPNSKTALISFFCGVFAAVMFLIALIIAGSSDMGTLYGMLGMLGLILAAGALSIGIISIKYDEDVKPGPARIGAALGGAFLILFIIMYIQGLVA